MASEHSKLLSLQSHSSLLSQQLSEAADRERSVKRELVTFADELDEVKQRAEREKGELEGEVRRLGREVREVGEDLRVARNELERERGATAQLRSSLASQAQAQLSLTQENTELKGMIGDLQRRLDETSAQVAQMQLVIEEKDKIVVKMRKEVFESEAIRRKLHNTILELKGNIRVFARVRPVLPSDLPSSARVEEIDEEEVEKVKARFAFPDEEEHKDIVLYSTSESAMGNERKEVYTFGFDRVFEPHSTQLEVFEEISQLAQSCVDGYNVCIFAYGQTGSGKSWTMEGGPTEDTAGMIPRAVEQVFRVAEEMKSKGWEYRIEGQFLEIYNETIHDLLTPFDASDKKKHEIKHDPKTGRTTVTELTVVPLTSPEQVKGLLARAQSRRSVAATLMNERSSRSHSVFTLRISGVHVGSRAMSSSSSSNTFGNGRGDFVQGTGEKCEGCLNLVDLAGSERLNVSFGPGVTEKERVRETQSINKSLSALGDVIAALGAAGGSGTSANGGGGAAGGNGGQNGVHIPYRNNDNNVDGPQPITASSAFERELDVVEVCDEGQSLSLRFDAQEERG
ncbi:hypothetical protein NMY22_g8984 [Coprinellus aureogranulatus]|nr:hypothetical protein NMY22_g8984 [Coprinellus aureogranulatus]